MRNFAIYAVLSLLVYSGCKKTPLPSEDPGNPVFSFKGYLNGNPEPVNFTAGNGNYYMHTACWPDNKHVYIYEGDLRSDCNPACNYGIKVQINDSKITTVNEKPDVDAALNGTHLYYNKNLLPTDQLVYFVPSRPLKDNEKFDWKIIRSANDVTAIESYSTTAVLALGSTYTVELSYLAGDGSCTTTHTNVFHVGNPFQASVNAVKQDQSLLFNFSATTSVTDQYQYLWEFGDGSTSTLAEPAHTYANEDNYTAKLTLINSKGETCISYYQVPAINEGLCQANFTAIFQPLKYDKIFKTITIFFTDKDGSVYSTADVIQPSSSKAEVSMVQEFEKNLNGQPTKKMKLTFNCQLKGDKGIINLDNAEALIAVSYKE